MQKPLLRSGEVQSKGPHSKAERYRISAFSPAIPSSAAERRILEMERYRPWLVHWLEDNEDFAVYLFTVRKMELSVCTLKSIEHKTGWLPHRAYFNYTKHIGAAGAPLAKEVMLNEKVLKEASPEQIFAFESNPKSRAMYREHGIRSREITCPEDIPTREQVLKPRREIEGELIERIGEVIRKRQTATGDEAKALAKERIRLRERLMSFAGVTMDEAIAMSSIEIDGKVIEY